MENLDLSLSYELLYLGRGAIDKTGGELTGRLQATTRPTWATSSR